jgi:5-methyltetrahydropteroyltriglutamate--homocysteine methyltransferase
MIRRLPRAGPAGHTHRAGPAGGAALRPYAHAETAGHPAGRPGHLRLPHQPRQSLRRQERDRLGAGPLINEELHRAVDAGATHIQLDEPSAIDDFVSLPISSPCSTAALEGLNATIGLHICFGNFMGRLAVAHRTYEYIAPIFPDLNVDIVHLEFANRGMWQTDLFSRYARPDQFLAAGVIDVKARAIETPAVVAERIRDVLRHTDAKRVWVSSDCGFSMTARWVGRGEAARDGRRHEDRAR